MNSSLCVMKFGGTSVGDADCIRRAAAIVKAAAEQRPVVAVVSAMSGVTNRLIDGARRAELGEHDFLHPLISALRTQHLTALKALTRDAQKSAEVQSMIEEVLGELERLLQGTAL